MTSSQETFAQSTGSALDRHRRRILVAVLAVAVLPYLFDLGRSSIWDANEAFYVETPREMIERGDYINPQFNYEPRFNKPVLSYWIVVAFYKLFGISVAVQRIPIALAGISLVGTAFLLARAGSTSRNAAWLAAIGLAANPRLFMFARRILIDMYITLFMALTLLCFVLAESRPAQRRTFLVLMYVCMGFGVLTKGPVALVIPALVCGSYLMLHGELHRVRELMLVPGLLVVVAIVAPWYVGLYAQHGWTYIWEFFVTENVGRYASGVGGLSRGPLFYVPVVFADALPCSFWLIPAASLWIDERRRRVRTTEMRVRSIAWLWIAVIVVFFSLSRTKQDLYIFPIVVSVAALSGDFIARALENGIGRRDWMRWTLVATGVTLALVGIGLLYLFEASRSAYLLNGIRLASGLMIAGGALVFVLSRSRQFTAALISVTVFVAFNWVLALRVLPSFERYKPVPALSATIARLAGPDDIVAHFDVALPSMVFYLRRHVEATSDPDVLRRWMQSDRRVFAVMTEDRYTSLRSSLRHASCVLDRRPTFDVKLNALLTHEAPSHLVLVGNACD